MNHYVTVEPGVSIFVEDLGAGKPIVFIAGWPFDNRCYEYQFTQLPQHGFRCIGIDIRGYGKSSRPWGVYSYDRFADDIHAVLNHLDVEGATLVGHSMGGAISLRYVAKHGNEYVSKLALCGAAAPLWTQRPDFPYGFTQQTATDMLNQCYQDRAKLIEGFGKIFFRTENSLSPVLAHWFDSIAMDASPHATAECIKLLRDTDLRADMERVMIPTAILHGAADKVCPFQLGEILHKNIKGSQLFPFEKSGHGLFYDERELFNKTIMDFSR
jgi:non-heme chloroperoxidase